MSQQEDENTRKAEKTAETNNTNNTVTGNTIITGSENPAIASPAVHHPLSDFKYLPLIASGADYLGSIINDKTIIFSDSLRTGVFGAEYQAKPVILSKNIYFHPHDYEKEEEVNKFLKSIGKRPIFEHPNFYLGLLLQNQTRLHRLVKKAGLVVLGKVLHSQKGEVFLEARSAEGNISITDTTESVVQKGHHVLYM